jgi:RNA polymerase sigma factor (sigma-70 family)
VAEKRRSATSPKDARPPSVDVVNHGAEKDSHDERLFTRLWDRHHELVRRYLIQRCPPEATEDLVQEVFLRVWLFRHRPLEEAQMPAFLMTVARNLWIDHLRWQRNWGNVISLDDVVLEAEHPERQLTANLRYDSVRAALQNLSPRRRAVFELRWMRGCSHRDIAARLQISVKTVENHLNAAYRDLRQLLQEPKINGSGGA